MFDLSRLQPSGEYEIKRAVVSTLLAQGWPRDKLRLEIPLDTASSGGRADVVLIGDDRLAAIELKSARDKFCANALGVQCDQYRRSFDSVCSIVDNAHRKQLEIKSRTEGWTRMEDNFSRVDFIYSHALGRITGTDDEHPIVVPAAAFLHKSFKTSPLDMASILWASEVKDIFGFRTKGAFLSIVHEEKCLSEVCPAVLRALTERPPNEWEKAFWERFEPLPDDLLAA